jgi:hypothetical protein
LYKISDNKYVAVENNEIERRCDKVEVMCSDIELQNLTLNGIGTNLEDILELLYVSDIMIFGNFRGNNILIEDKVDVSVYISSGGSSFF